MNIVLGWGYLINKKDLNSIKDSLKYCRDKYILYEKEDQIFLTKDGDHMILKELMEIPTELLYKSIRKEKFVVFKFEKYETLNLGEIQFLKSSFCLYKENSNEDEELSFLKMGKDMKLSEHFENLSNILLNNIILCLRNVDNIYVYKIIDIEFYAWNDGHKDFFSPKVDEHQLLGRWYFHRSSKNYKKGNFKGIDITFGNNQTYASIKIISIKNINNGKIISGSSKCVDEILEKLKVDNVSSLLSKYDLSLVKGPLYIKYKNQSVKYDKIYNTSRTTLSFSKIKHLALNDYNWKYYIDNYRYTVDPKLSYGKIHILIDYFKKEIDDYKEISKVIDIGSTIIEKYHKYWINIGDIEQSISKINTKPTNQEYIMISSWLNKLYRI